MPPEGYAVNFPIPDWKNDHQVPSPSTDAQSLFERPFETKGVEITSFNCIYHRPILSTMLASWASWFILVI